MKRTGKPSAKPKPRVHKDHHPAPPLPPPTPEPPKPEVDLNECFTHLLVALDGLARNAGSPPEVVHALDALRALLGKECHA